MMRNDDSSKPLEAPEPPVLTNQATKDTSKSTVEGTKSADLTKKTEQVDTDQGTKSTNETLSNGELHSFLKN